MSSPPDDVQPRQLTLREAVVAGITGEMDRDKSVIIIGQDIGAFHGPLRSTEGLLERFGPDRVIETPICEGSMTAMAPAQNLHQPSATTTRASE
jgi:acetoin:2,6-dichlorophenolindophenol oxidoreductase subunit beta